MKSGAKIILASESPGRKKLLEDAGYIFEAIPSSFVEDITLPMSPSELVIYLSQGKARAVAAQNPDAIVIGADTVCVFGNAVLGKPHTEENSNKMLALFNGTFHSVLTGLTVIDGRRENGAKSSRKKEINKIVETKIWFRTVPMEEIVAYSKSGEGLKKAGGYAYQLNGKKFIDRVKGSDSNIMGMPLETLAEILKELSD